MSQKITDFGRIACQRLANKLSLIASQQLDFWQRSLLGSSQMINSIVRFWTGFATIAAPEILDCGKILSSEIQLCPSPQVLSAVDQSTEMQATQTARRT